MDYWSDYWQQGHITSFGSDFAEGYNGVLKFVWHQYFKQFEDGGEILDLCCGNGALANLALSISNRVNVTGVDRAILNEEHTNRAGKQILGGVDVADLPFDDSQFDGVTSQFGIEYANWPDAIAQAERVMRAGGKFQFVCHDTSSFILRLNNETLECLEHITAPRGFISLLSQGESKEKVDGLGKKLLTLYPRTLADTQLPQFYQYYLGLCSDRERENAIKLYLTNTHHHQQRLYSLKQAALDTEKKEEFIQTCYNNGFEVQSNSALHDQEGALVAWVISGIKV